MTPKILTGEKDFNKEYFDKIDTIENNIFDGISFENIVKNFNLFNFKKVNNINLKKINSEISKNNNLNEKLLKKAFLIKKVNSPEMIQINENYFLVNIHNETKKDISIDDKDVQDLIINQIIIKKKIDGNTKIAKDIG